MAAGFSAPALLLLALRGRLWPRRSTRVYASLPTGGKQQQAAAQPSRRKKSKKKRQAAEQSACATPAVDT